jgi:hypothetical protein
MNRPYVGRELTYRRRSLLYAFFGFELPNLEGRMTEMQDPMEIYRASLNAIPVTVEGTPPTIERAEVWPYPDLIRLWARVQVGPFARHPDLSFRVMDPDGQTVCALYMVEIREPYQSITLHLRQSPRPDARYHLEIELIRDDEKLADRTLEFDLTYREPQAPAAADG